MQEKTILDHMENKHRIRKSTDPVFLLELQRGLLLELMVRGFLNRSQYSYAEETLRRQFRNLMEDEG